VKTKTGYLVLSFPLGSTVVVGAMGRVEAAVESLGALVSFLGFFAILLLRCSPLGMVFSLCRFCVAVGDMDPALEHHHTGVWYSGASWVSASGASGAGCALR